jgi:ATP/maltotriose-dependent transcriptional regulator MalT
MYKKMYTNFIWQKDVLNKKTVTQECTVSNLESFKTAIKTYLLEHFLESLPKDLKNTSTLLVLSIAPKNIT